MHAKIITPYLAAAAFFFVLSICAVVLPNKNSDPSFHKEIIPSNAISYIKDDKLVALADGKYLLAMPAGGTFVKGVAPMLLVKVGHEHYPLNIADDSILPRQGRMLPLKILFGFTSPHASNTLKYEEKTGGDPKLSYLRKARYYLHVENGYGTVKRSYYYQ
jgi:hypothetical protein